MGTSQRPLPGASAPGPWELLRTSIPELPDGLGLIGEDGRLFFLNREGARLLGLEAGAPGGRLTTWTRTLKPEEGPAELPPLRALRGEHVREEVVRLELSGRPPRWLSFSASPLHEQGGAPRGSVFRCRDVSDEWARRRDRERELSRRLRQRGALLQLLRRDWPTASDLRQAL